jgi:hypothetical protein
MENQKKIRHLINLFIIAGFLLGCYATTHRGPRTLDKGQVSLGGIYGRLNDVKETENKFEAIMLDWRIGVMNGLDMGYMRTIEITEDKDADSDYDTHWLDAKYQILNRDNSLYMPTLSVGWGFGKVINAANTWINNLYLSLGFQTKWSTFFYTYIHAMPDDEFNLNPSWAWNKNYDNDITKAHILGFEYDMTPNFKPVIEYGRFYNARVNRTNDFSVFTIGIHFYSDSQPKIVHPPTLAESKSPIDKGSYLLSGGLSYTYTSSEGEYWDNQKGERTSKNFTISPGIYYFFLPNFAAGGTFTYSKINYKDNIFGMNQNWTSSSFGAGPGLRYYFIGKNPYPFVSLSYLSTTSDSDNAITASTSSDLSLGVGANYFLSKNIAIEPFIHYHIIDSKSSISSYFDSAMHQDHIMFEIGIGISAFVF